MDDFYASVFQMRQYLRRVATGRLNSFNATFDNRFDVSWIVRCVDSWKEGQVHTERFVGHVPTASNFVCEVFWRLLR